MNRHASVFVQSIMHMAIENMSSAYVDVLKTSSIFCVRACMYAYNIKHMSNRVVMTCMYSSSITCTFLIHSYK